MKEQLSELLAQVTEPSRIEVLRAKRAMLRLLYDGSAQHVDGLLSALAREEGLESPGSDPQFRSEEEGNFHVVVTQDHALVKWERYQIASLEALGDLQAEGIVVAVGSRHAGIDSTRRIGIRTPRSGDSVSWTRIIPQPASQAYRVAHRHLGGPALQLDPDLFLAPLAPLLLDIRTERCAREAIDAYRKGLFLASASLLGATSEGAWYSAANVLVSAHSDLQSLIDSDATARLQKSVARIIREHLPKGRSWVADDLETHASLLRELRNFGVHPAAYPDDDLASYFTEERCGILLLNTHRYLGSLAREVASVRT